MFTFNSGDVIKAKLVALHLKVTGKKPEPFDFLSGEGVHDKLLKEVFYNGPNKQGLIDLYRSIANHPEEVHFLVVDRTSEEAMAEGTPPAIFSVLPDGTKAVFFSKDVLYREAIGHELVHVWQCLRGDLMVLSPTTMKWKGEEYPIITDGSNAYFRLPWEQEAYEFQSTLMCEEGAKALRKVALLD